MSNEWVRLWHDMPTDPKWRTISRLSKQSIGNVMAVYLHLLVDASANATERGRTQTIAAEHIASALDLEDAQVEAILTQMEDRVIKNGALTGWSKRNPKREDGSAERAKTWRNAQKEDKNEVKTEIQNDTEHEQTQPNATEPKRPLDKDTEKDKDIKKTKAKKTDDPRFNRLFNIYPNKVDRKQAEIAFKKIIGDDDVLLDRAVSAVAAQIQEREWKFKHGALVPDWRSLERWLKAAKWEDPIKTEAEIQAQTPKPKGFNQPVQQSLTPEQRVANEAKNKAEQEKRDEAEQKQKAVWETKYPDVFKALPYSHALNECIALDKQNMAKTA